MIIIRNILSVLVKILIQRKFSTVEIVYILLWACGNTNNLQVYPLLAYRLFTAAYFNVWLVPLLAVSSDCFCNVKAQRCKESGFFGQGSNSFRWYFPDIWMDTHMDNCKISIMMVVEWTIGFKVAKHWGSMKKCYTILHTHVYLLYSLPSFEGSLHKIFPISVEYTGATFPTCT